MEEANQIASQPRVGHKTPKPWSRMFENKLRQARLDYAGKLHGRLHELRTLVQRACGLSMDEQTAGSAAVMDMLQTAQSLAHRICGSAGTFGFEEVGQAVRLVDQRLVAVLSGASPLTSELWDALDQALQQALAQAQQH